MSARTVLVTGATGKQGGAVIDALMLDKDHASQFSILALTRNVDSPAARKLKSNYPSIKLLPGDLNDTPAIFSSAKAPIWGVFSVQTPMGPRGTSVETEEKQGKDLVDAALANGVEHFVYTSVDRHGEDSANNPTNIPHFVSKHRIEKHLQEKAKGSNMTWTILRPVFFVENFSGDFMGKMIATTWRVALGEKRKLQVVSIQDIGFFAARAFTSVQEYQNRSISLAGDEITYSELNQMYKDKTGTGVPTTFSIFAYLLLWLSKEMKTMFAFFKDPGFDADIAALKKVNPNMESFSTWLGRQK